MPLYEYRCGSCGQVFEVLQKFADVPLTAHESCGGAVEKLISASAFQFKGSGFYVTDYARAKGPSNGDKGGESKSDGGGETKSDKGGESKSGESKSGGGDSGGKTETKTGTKTEAKSESKDSSKPAAKIEK